MITATCDNCKKDLGQVPLEVILDESGIYRNAIAMKRKFKLATTMDKPARTLIACSKKCAKQIDKNEQQSKHTS